MKSKKPTSSMDWFISLTKDVEQNGLGYEILSPSKEAGVTRGLLATGDDAMTADELLAMELGVSRVM